MRVEVYRVPAEMGYAWDHQPRTTGPPAASPVHQQYIAETPGLHAGLPSATGRALDG